MIDIVKREGGWTMVVVVVDALHYDEMRDYLRRWDAAFVVVV